MPTGNVFSIGAGLQVQRIQGDITKITVDAILNVANPALAGGGGVDGPSTEAVQRIFEKCTSAG